MKKRAGLMAGLILLLILKSSGVTPQKWELLRWDDFLRGKLQGLALSSEGRLSLTFKQETIAGPAEEFYLSFLLAPDGTLYLGTGHSGKIYRLRGGKSELYFQAPEMDVTCLAQDAKGVLYAGTSPNGKIYRISGVGQAEPFFNPDEKYIWDLLFTEKGTLLAAVGERGGIYEISPQGEGRLLLKAEENHILCLLRTASGDIYAGSGGPGVIYYLKPGGKTSLLFETSYEEVKSLAADGAGNIYVAASGTPPRERKEEPAVPGRKGSSSTEVTITVTPGGVERSAIAPSGPESREPGAVFRLIPDGVAKKLWSSPEELVYSLLFSREERKLYFGTGGKGRIYAVDQDDRVTLVYEGRFEQAYGLFPGESKIFILGNNPCTLGSLLREQSLEGEFLSPVLEARTSAAWGRLEWLAEVPAGCALLFQSRSGNSYQPNETWSDWSPLYQKSGEQILSPRGRYLQIKALFRSQTGKSSPVLQRITAFYLPANVAPVIARIDVLPPNEVFLKPPDQEDVIWGLDPSRRSLKSSREESRVSMLAARKVERKGYQTFQWEANDENGDDLVFQLYLRKEGEKEWRLLAENWSENLYVLDTTAFPDGTYELRLVASDSPSNTPDSELKAEKISLPFVVDNSPPVIKNVLAVRKGDQLELSFEVEDAYSAIEKADVLLRPDFWRVVFPDDGICDSRNENFHLQLSLKPASEKMAVIRVRDRHGNVAVWWQAF